jgi:hypothetical protein
MTRIVFVSWRRASSGKISPLNSFPGNATIMYSTGRYSSLLLSHGLPLGTGGAQL